MKLALHLRNPETIENKDALKDWFIKSAASAALMDEDRSDELFQSLTRIYVGDEFCFRRLPSPDEFKKACSFTHDTGLGLTLLTPVLTEAEFDACTDLLDFIADNNPETEIVVNDWGVLCLLRKRSTDYRIGAGRLLNKGFKDPRLVEAGQLSSLSGEAGELLKTSTFDHENVREKLRNLGVSRFERDLFPYGEVNIKGRSAASIYYPFGYLTTGRICWMGAVGSKREKKFIAGSECSRVCERLVLKREAPLYSHPLLISGNTVYYRYSSEQIVSLIARTQNQDIRLVYQGMAIGL